MSSSSGAGPLVPTFHGFVHNSMDGLVLFEACLSGKLHHVPRRPHDRERSSLIKSGSIFIYEENASGIKRWTDGVAWSPSRILGNFLIYRELEKPFPPGEKKRAMKRKRSSMPGEPYPRRESDENDNSELTTPLTPPTPNIASEGKSDMGPSSDHDKELERSLIGSLVDSYGFRPDGLVKKTMSISVNGISHHMVSYYKVDDVKNNLLPRPLSDPRLANISVRPDLYMKQNFRAPVEESEQYAIDNHLHVHPQMMYSSMPGGAYGVRPGQYFGSQYPGMYAVPPSTGANMYGGVTGSAWSPHHPASAGAMSYGAPPYGSQSYSPYYKPPGGPSSASGPKQEESQPPSQGIPYPHHYPTPYTGVQRHGSYSQQAPSPYGSMSGSNGRPSYGGSMQSPTATNGQSQPVYGNAPSQSYAVRSPTQTYGIQSAPQSAVPPSPHSAVKSPHSAHPATPSQSDPNSQMHYRSNSYPVAHSNPPSGHPSGGGDINGLGISNNSSYSTGPGAPNSSGYSSYTSSGGQAYRPVGDVSTTSQSSGQYAS